MFCQSCTVLFLLAGFLVLPTFGLPDELFVFRKDCRAHPIRVTVSIYGHNKEFLNRKFPEKAETFVPESAYLYCSCRNHYKENPILDENHIIAYWIHETDNKMLSDYLTFYQKVNILFLTINSIKDDPN